MSISNLHISCSANILIKQHGEDAAIRVAMKADELLAKGDMESAVARSIRIMRMVREI